MSIKTIAYCFVFILISQFAFSQNPIDHTLIHADQKFIKEHWLDAAHTYERYLAKYPKDFYASRQAALCYNVLNNHSKAIDHWTNVYENAQASDRDKLEYGKSLLANYRNVEAKRIFVEIGKSSDKILASWALAYTDMNLFYEDSLACKIYELTGGVNSTKTEYSPYQYKNELIFIKQERRPLNPFSKWKSERHFGIYSLIKNDSVNFEVKARKFNPPIQSKFLNGQVAFTPGDSTIYFTRSASPSEMKKVKSSILKQQIFYTEVNSYGVARPEIQPFIHNSPNYNIKHPTIDKTGTKMYFSSNMPGTIGGDDIWLTEKKDGVWGKPINLGPQVNTNGNENYPFIAEDGILYFASDTRPGLGGLDIFYADPSHDEKLFFDAENSGTGINTQFDDFGISVGKNGVRGYLSSNRKNYLVDDDIYYFVNNKPKVILAKLKFVDSVSRQPITVDFELTTSVGTFGQRLDSGAIYSKRLKISKEIKVHATSAGYIGKTILKNLEEADTLLVIELRPKSQKCIQGKIIDKETNTPLSGVKVAIYDEHGNNYMDVITADDGFYKMCQLPLDIDLYIGAQKKPEFFSNTERFRVLRDSDLVKDIFTQKIVIGKAIKIENIYFEFGKWDVNPDASVELDKLVNLMRDNPEIVIELSSHTDCNGSAGSNMTLSDKRAKSSASYIVSKGIASSRIKGQGYGESKLLNDCKCEGKTESTCTEAQHAVNRRTEFKVTGFVEKTVRKKEKTGHRGED